MRTTFKNIKIGETFHTGIQAASFPYNQECYMGYKKESKSSAVCIFQQGYGNQRAINAKYSFSANSLIVPCEF